MSVDALSSAASVDCSSASRRPCCSTPVASERSASVESAMVKAITSRAFLRKDITGILIDARPAFARPVPATDPAPHFTAETAVAPRRMRYSRRGAVASRGLRTQAALPGRTLTGDALMGDALRGDTLAGGAWTSHA